MPLTKAEKQQVYELFEALGIEPSGDLRADAAAASKKYVEMINQVDTAVDEGLEDASGGIGLLSGAMSLASGIDGDDIDPISQIPAEYTPEFGGILATSTAQFADFIPNIESDLKENEDLPQRYRDNPDALVALLRKAPQVVEILDREYGNDWFTQDGAQVATITPQNDAPEATFMERYNAQMAFAQYKLGIYNTQYSDPDPETGAVQPIATDAPQGQETDLYFTSNNYEYMQSLVTRAYNLIARVPNTAGIYRALPEDIDQRFYMPEGDDLTDEALEEWYQKSKTLMVVFNDPDFLETLQQSARISVPNENYTGSNYSAPTTAVMTDITQEDLEELALLNQEMRFSLMVNEALEAGIAGPDAQEITQQEIAGYRNAVFWNPGGPYRLDGQAIAEIENVKQALGDTSQEGMLGHNFEAAMDQRVANLMLDNIQNLDALIEHFPEETKAEISNLNHWVEDTYGFNGNNPFANFLFNDANPLDESANEFLGPLAPPQGPLLPVVPEYTPEKYLEILERANESLVTTLEQAEGLSAAEQKKLTDALQPYQGNMFEIATLLQLKSQMINMETMTTPAQELALAESGNTQPNASGSEGDDLTGGDPSAPLEGVALASQKIEEFLMEVKPMLEANGLGDKIEIPTTADGTFDETSQKALQGVMLALDGLGVDMGQNAWLYTPAKGAAISNDENLLNKMIVQQLNAEEEIVGLDDEGDLIYLKDSEEDGIKVGDKVSDDIVVTLQTKAKEKIDSLVENLNILHANNKLANDNLIGANSAVELAMGSGGSMLMGIVQWLAGVWPQAIPFLADIVGFFTGGKVDLYDMLDKTPDGLIQGNSALSTVANAIGLHGSDAANPLERMKDNFVTAMTAKNEDGTAVTLDQMKEKVVELMGQVPSDLVDEQTYNQIVERAFERAQESLGDPDDPDYDRAAQAFATIVAEEQTTALNAATPSQDLELDIPRRQDPQASLSAQFGYSNLAARPFFDIENGRTYVEYMDAIHEAEMTEALEDLEYYRANEIDGYDKQIEGAENMILRLESKIANSDDYQDYKLDEFREDLAYYQAYKSYMEAQRAANIPHYNELVARYNELAAEPIYKRVDITDEAAHVMAGGIMNKGDTPVLYNVGIQQGANLYYMDWDDDAMVRNALQSVGQYHNRNTPNESNLGSLFSRASSAPARPTKQQREAERFRDKWERLDELEEQGADVDARRERLLAQFDKKHSDNIYLRREEFSETVAEVTGQGSVSPNDPALQPAPAP